MKITNKSFSLPPYLSTHWANISSLHTLQDSTLVVTLLDGYTVEIPGLDQATMEIIFKAHETHLEQAADAPPTNKSSALSQIQSFPFAVPVKSDAFSKGDSPFRFAVAPFEDLGSSVFQHDSLNGHIPNIPLEILSKIVAITKIVAPAEMQGFPKAEPHCNCVHCQISRTVHEETREDVHSTATVLESIEPVVQDEDLNFQQWDIQQTGDQFFAVMNKLNPTEKYNVFLGQPMGCTCGKTCKPGEASCEHIIAVLRS